MAYFALFTDAKGKRIDEYLPLRVTLFLARLCQIEYSEEMNLLIDEASEVRTNSGIGLRV